MNSIRIFTRFGVIAALSAVAGLTTPLLLILPVFVGRIFLRSGTAQLLDAGWMRQMAAEAHWEDDLDAPKVLAREVIDGTFTLVAVILLSYFFVEWVTT